MIRLIKKFTLEISILIIIGIVSILHYSTGISKLSMHGLIRILYIVPIVLSAFRYGFKGGVIVSVLINIIYSPHMLLSVGFGLQTMNEVYDIFLFFFIGIITGTMAEKKNQKLAISEIEVRKHILLEKYNNGIIESIKSGVLVINNEMFITIVNQGAKELLGVKADIIGKSFIEVFSGYTDIEARISEASSHYKIIENIEVTLNASKEISINIYPLTLNSTNKGLVIIIDDIAEIKRLKSHLDRSEKLAALGELSSGIAHEIRNPLAIIKAVEQTMKNELKNNIEALEELQIIDEEINRANKIVTSLMEFAKPSKGQIVLQSIEAIIEEVLIIINKYVDQRHIDISFEKSADSFVLADKESLKQAVINIIFNAVDAMPKGGMLKISSRLQEDRWVKIVFEDNGIGIEDKDIKKIFNPFYTTKETGTGLGLSIVHRIVEEHNGTIDVSSKIGIGTKFEILLPAKKEGAALNEENINS